MTTPVPRPNPLGEVASKIGVAWAAVSGLVTGAVTFGVLTAAQGEAITAVGAQTQDTVTALGTAIAVILPLIGSVVTAFRTASAGKDHVTPIADPRTNAGVALTPDVPADVVGPLGPTSSGPTGEHRA